MFDFFFLDAHCIHCIQYDSRNESVGTPVHLKPKGSFRLGTVPEKENLECDAYLAILKIFVKVPGKMFTQTLDMKMLLPANIRAKSVTIATTEDCLSMARSPNTMDFRKGGLYDAVWYHDGFTDPESVLNLPLGPAYTMPFTSTEEAMKRAASKRTYMYNIVMSLFTGMAPKHSHSTRKKWESAHANFTRYIKHRSYQPRTSMAVPHPRRVCSYAAITKKWHAPDWISPDSPPAHVQTDEDNCNRVAVQKINQTVYHRVLLDSAFTLSPAGHNHECFRMWEAAEAGSIPVLLVNETSTFGGEVNVTGCSLHPDVMKAPFIWAADLPDAWRQMEELWNNEHALNARSREVRAWYNRYMTLTIGRVEQLLRRAVEGGKRTDQN